MKYEVRVTQVDKFSRTFEVDAESKEQAEANVRKEMVGNEDLATWSNTLDASDQYFTIKEVVAEPQRQSTEHLEGVGPTPGQSVWNKSKYRQPVARLVHRGESNNHAPNDWHMIVYDDGTLVDRHAETHPWSPAFMALERIEGGTLRDYVNGRLAQGWELVEERFRNEPRVYTLAQQ